MKKLIVLLFLASSFVFAQNTPQKGRRPNDEESGLYRQRTDEDDGTPQRGRRRIVDVTPSSVSERLRRQEGLRTIQSFFGRNSRGNADDTLYIGTVGDADLRHVPILDLGNQVLTENDINCIIRTVRNHLQNLNAFVYVGITGQGSERRAREHHLAASERGERRFYRAALGSPEGALVHTLLIGVNSEQRPHLEAQIIRALGATGPMGLNGNAGSLGVEESGVRGQIDVTPNTRMPSVTGRRTAQYLDGEELRPHSPAQLPENWQNILYLMTPPGVDIEAPIIDLGGQLLDDTQLDFVMSTIHSYFQDATYERYVGQATEGEHGDRTAMTRACEHERASLDAPYRRLPLAITRVNQRTGQSVQLHALLAGVHPDQIDNLEHLMILALNGTGPLGWNSNPGSQPRERGTVIAARNLFPDTDPVPTQDTVAAAATGSAPAGQTVGWMRRALVWTATALAALAQPLIAPVSGGRRLIGG